MSTLAQDLRFAFRNLWKFRGISAFIAVSVALAIAGNAATFSLVSGLMLRPFPYPEAERLTFLWDVELANPENRDALSPPNFLDLRERAKSFAAMEGFSNQTFHLTGGDQPEEVAAVRTTPGGLGMLGFQPILGRAMRAEDGLLGNEHVALLTEPLWRRRFGGDPAVIGRTIELDDEKFEVVGILPANAEFLSRDVGLWVPLTLDPKAPRDQRTMIGIGRVAAGVDIATAKREVESIGAALAQEHVAANRGRTLRALKLREVIPGETDRRIFAMMQVVMALILLIACANVANLLLARGQDRQREIALRTTLGAGRGRIVRQLLTESVVLALLGGALGLALSKFGIDAIANALAGQVPGIFLPRLDGSVLGFTAAIVLLGGILFGLYPAFEASRPELSSTLREGGKGASGSRRRRRVIRGLVVAEIAFALGALAATGIIVRTMIALSNLDPGFKSANLLTVRVGLPERRYPEPAQTERFYRQVTERFAALPGVEGATAAAALPRLQNQPASAFTIDGAPVPAGETPREVAIAVLPNYFDVMGIQVVEGRGLNDFDRVDTAPVVVVSRSFAKRYFGNTSPLGKRLTLDGASREVVGLASDVIQSRIPGLDGPAPLIYLPQGQTTAREMFAILRTPTKPTALADPIRAALGELDRALPVSGIETLDHRIAEEMVGARLIATVLGGFGVVALLLAALGIYGVISYSVAQQTREIGIRMAIGAERRTVLSEVAKQGLRLLAWGFAIGAPLVGLAVQGIRATFQGAIPFGYSSLALVAFALVAVAALASYLPALRAANLDPAIALRRD